MKNKETLSPELTSILLNTLKTRFEKHMERHPNLDWQFVESKLQSNPEKLWILSEMENTGGEPDVITFHENVEEIIFVDCTAESPKGRRSFCYDQEALDARKEHKPKDSAVGFAKGLGIALLTEAEYAVLQETGKYDLKTSSWLETDAAVRKLGGALFGDRRYDRVFTYHNGAESYYAARGFRAKLVL